MSIFLGEWPATVVTFSLNEKQTVFCLQKYRAIEAIQKKITSESCLFSQWQQSNIQGVLLTHAKTLEVYTRGQK